MKKYLLGLLAVPIMSPLLSIASAGWVSDCEINSCSFTHEGPEFDGDDDKLVCSMTQDYVNFGVKYSPTDIDIQSSDGTVTCSNGLCTASALYDYNEKLYFFLENGNVNDLSLSNCAYVADSCSLTWVDDSSSGGSSESELPGLSVSSSFTSGITDLVNNFGSTVVNWLPTVILITLGITAIFALFRVVRSYARRSFKG